MTLSVLRRSFWLTFFVCGKPAEYRGKTQNDLPCDLRCAWVDYVDQMHRDGHITDRVADNATLA